ncbi:hypothetical protein M0R36_05535 [bacterium]|nr:hypothetical protein [bacterium]
MDIKYVLLKAPGCAADLSDGSERGEYVPQNYIFNTLGRPSRAINLMYEYHPNDKNWPEKGILENKLYKRNRRTNGYFPYMAIETGGTACEPFKSMRDIRKFGQDIILTMTFDLDTPDEHLVQIAKDLRPFGNVIFRINHECNGCWFTYNKENTYGEVSDFFVKFHKILKRYAPNVKTNACLNGVHPEGSDVVYHMGEKELAPAFRIADIISYDSYHSLHWGWPHDGYDPAKSNFSSGTSRVKKMGQMTRKQWWELFFDFNELMLRVNQGRQKEIYLGEVNTDADIVGLKDQAQWIKEFYNDVKKKKLSYLKGITYYQFRDRGGLGLEYEMDEEMTKGRPNPSLNAYSEAVKDPYFSPVLEEKGPVEWPAVLEWESSTCARGVMFSFVIPAGASKCLIVFSREANLIIKAGDMWFHKDTGCDELDISAAVEPGVLNKIFIFAPPVTGENTHDPDNPRYLDVYRYNLTGKPDIILK